MGEPRRDREESFCRLLENRYRFSAAAQKDNGMTLADMERPDSTCLEDDRLTVFPSFSIPAVSDAAALFRRRCGHFLAFAFPWFHPKKWSLFSNSAFNRNLYIIFFPLNDRLPTFLKNYLFENNAPAIYRNAKNNCSRN